MLVLAALAGWLVLVFNGVVGDAKLFHYFHIINAEGVRCRYNRAI